MAGLDYITPWTRDATINTWNAMALLSGEVSKNTLMSVLNEENGEVYIGGQYWDAIIWLIGAYEYAIVNCDDEFLRLAYQAGKNSMRKFEAEEFDNEKYLFRGPAVYGDGTAAYPDKYANCLDNSSSILKWVENPENPKAEKGFGLPMFALSTNCVYFKAYEILAMLADKHGENGSTYCTKAIKLKEAINKHFWNSTTNNYDYLAGECDHNEGMGLAFAILFDVADDERIKEIYRNTYVSPYGIPCVWPTFDRYKSLNGFGRHSGTVWPHIQAFWALAMLKSGKPKAFEKELNILANNSYRDMHFSEIYHPETGMPYGGLQENTDMFNPDCNYMSKSEEQIREQYNPMCANEWNSLRKQTWSATGFLSLIFYGILGLSVKNGKPEFATYLPDCCSEIKITGIKVCNRVFDIHICKNKTEILERE